jgi:hypothetical protein
MLMPWNQQKILERSKLQNSVLGSSPGEGGFCSLETKQDRRRKQRQKLLVLMRRLQEQGHTPKKTVLCLSPGNMVSVAQKLSTIEKQQQDRSSLSWQGDYRNKITTQKAVLDSSPSKDGFCS